MCNPPTPPYPWGLFVDLISSSMSPRGRGHGHTGPASRHLTGPCALQGTPFTFVISSFPSPVLGPKVPHTRDPKKSQSWPGDTQGPGEGSHAGKQTVTASWP